MVRAKHGYLGNRVLREGAGSWPACVRPSLVKRFMIFSANRPIRVSRLAKRSYARGQYGVFTAGGVTCTPARYFGTRTRTLVPAPTPVSITSPYSSP